MLAKSVAGIGSFADGYTIQNQMDFSCIEGTYGRTDLTGIREINDVRHVLFFPNCMTTCAGDDVFSVDAKQLGDWSCCGGIITALVQGSEDVWIVRERVALQAEVVKEESVERLDHVRIVRFSWFSPVINYIDYMLS
jgi:hypothetical protein